MLGTVQLRWYCVIKTMTDCKISACEDIPPACGHMAGMCTNIQLKIVVNYSVSSPSHASVSPLILLQSACSSEFAQIYTDFFFFFCCSRDLYLRSHLCQLSSLDSPVSPRSQWWVNIKEPQSSAFTASLFSLVSSLLAPLYGHKMLIWRTLKLPVFMVLSLIEALRLTAEFEFLSLGKKKKKNQQHSCRHLVHRFPQQTKSVH